MSLLLDLSAQNDNIELINMLNRFIENKQYINIINDPDFIDFINNFVEHEYGVAHKFIFSNGKFEVVDEDRI